MIAPGHNGQLRAFVERIERIEEEIAAMNSDKSEVYKEAKGSGYDVKVLRKVVAARRKDPSERAEEDAIFDLYMAALNGSESLVRAHVENIEQFPPHDAETGELAGEESEGGAFVAVTVQNRLADAIGVEPSSSEQDRTGMGNTAAATTGEAAGEAFTPSTPVKDHDDFEPPAFLAKTIDHYGGASR